MGQIRLHLLLFCQLILRGLVIFMHYPPLASATTWITAFTICHLSTHWFMGRLHAGCCCFSRVSVSHLNRQKTLTADVGIDFLLLVSPSWQCGVHLLPGHHHGHPGPRMVTKHQLPHEKSTAEAVRNETRQRWWWCTFKLPSLSLSSLSLPPCGSLLPLPGTRADQDPGS